MVVIQRLCGHRLYSSIAQVARSPNRHFSFSRSQRNADEQSNFLESFIQSHEPAQETIDYFSSIEWARKYVKNDTHEIVPFFSRYYNKITNENRFFARTVNTAITIPHLLSLRVKEMKTPDAPVELDAPKMSPVSAEQISNPEVICLMSLREGLDAHPSVVHGGFQCVIFDEIMRFLILLHQNNVSKPGPRDIHYTLNMVTKFSAPVVTPCDVLVRAQLVGRERRKWMAKAEIVSGNGQVLTSAESLWLTSKKGAII